jgi:hypothetical protein
MDLFLTKFNLTDPNLYTETGTHLSGKALKAHLGLQADHSILLLEDFDHLLQRVECIGSTMTITMHSSHIYQKARIACEPLRGGMLISSHFYRVS